MSDSKLRPLVVGIFAIQGSVEEHASCVKKCGGIVQEVCCNGCCRTRF
jgi:glutamine amidotransferase PdxT